MFCFPRLLVLECTSCQGLVLFLVRASWRFELFCFLSVRCSVREEPTCRLDSVEECNTPPPVACAAPLSDLQIVRRQVLTSVLEQVTARSQGVMGYVKLLGLLAERSPKLLLDDAEAVRDVFGYISILPPPVAERFLLAVAPLLRLRPRLQDSVVLPLRKALFSREERARLVAVGGLVLLLGIQSRSAGAADGRRGAGMHGGTQLSQSSQASQGWSSASLPLAAGAGESGRALSLAEGFGLLRRCLTQQMVVRAKLYDGLLASFARG